MIGDIVKWNQNIEKDHVLITWIVNKYSWFWFMYIFKKISLNMYNIFLKHRNILIHMYNIFLKMSKIQICILNCIFNVYLGKPS